MGPRRLVRPIASALVLTSVAACGSTESPTSTPPDNACTVQPPFHSFADLGNAGDGSDLVARLLPPVDVGCTDGFKVVVSAEGSMLPDADAVLAVPDARALQLTSTFSAGRFDFGDIGVDASGAPLVEGSRYRLQIAAFGSEPSVLVSSSSSVLLENADVLKTLTEPIDAGSGGMETDDQGNIYTADFGAALSGPPGTRVHRVTPEGSVSVFATGFQGASGNDRAVNGDLFQSSIQGGRIHRVTPGGSVTTFATGLAGPVGIVALPGDTLIVAGCGDNTIRRVEPDGSVSTFSSSGLLNCPNGITRADDGNYYIANFSDGRILKMTPTGTVSTLGSLASGNAGHILWGRGALWVVDRRGNRIVRMTLDGQSTPVAGTGARGSIDGPALSATMSLPNDVAFSPDQSILYINDVAQATQTEDVISPVLIRALVFARPQ